jgi:HK97 family phage major capsid protein
VTSIKEYPMSTTALREQRARANQARIDALRNNNQVSYTKANADVDRLELEIRKAEGKSPVAVETRGGDVNHRRAFNFAKYLRGKALTEAELRDIAEGAPMLNHMGSYTSLGFFVPTGFENQIENATKYYAPLLDSDVFTTMTTASGNPLPFPTSNDTNQSAAIVGEGASIPQMDPSAGQIIFAAYKLTSGVVKASVGNCF